LKEEEEEAEVESDERCIEQLRELLKCL